MCGCLVGLQWSSNSHHNFQDAMVVCEVLLLGMQVSAGTRWGNRWGRRVHNINNTHAVSAYQRRISHLSWNPLGWMRSTGSGSSSHDVVCWAKQGFEHRSLTPSTPTAQVLTMLLLVVLPSIAGLWDAWREKRKRKQRNWYAAAEAAIRAVDDEELEGPRR